MKTTSLALALTVSLAASAALAGDEVKDTKPAKAPPAKTKAVAAKPAKPAKADAKTELTGSYVKRDIRRAGLITDGSDQVLVIDSETIQNSGAADLRQLLVRKGIR